MNKEIKQALELFEVFMPKHILIDDEKQLAMYNAYHLLKQSKTASEQSVKTVGSVDSIKNKVAREKGYPNWDEYYNWIAKDGEYPSVVAQLIEAAMTQVLEEYANQFK